MPPPPASRRSMSPSGTEAASIVQVTVARTRVVWSFPRAVTLNDPGGSSFAAAGDRMAHTGEQAPSRRRELLMFLVLAVFIWPFIAVAVVGGYGFIVWMNYLFTGPPGPV